MWMYLCEREEKTPLQAFQLKAIAPCFGIVARVSGLRRKGKRRRADDRSLIRKLYMRSAVIDNCII